MRSFPNMTEILKRTICFPYFIFICLNYVALYLPLDSKKFDLFTIDEGKNCFFFLDIFCALHPKDIFDVDYCIGWQRTHLFSFFFITCWSHNISMRYMPRVQTSLESQFPLSPGNGIRFSQHEVGGLSCYYLVSTHSLPRFFFLLYNKDERIHVMFVSFLFFYWLTL